MEIIVYTAIFGDYDILHPPHPDSNCPHYCFTDGDYKCDGWITIKIARKYSTPRLDARRCKVLGPWELLPRTDVTLWQDGAMRQKVGINESLATELLGDNDIARYKHRWNDCVKDEVESCVKSKKDDETLMRNQVSRYFSTGFPTGFGVSLTGVLFRKTMKCEEFCRMWWREIRSGSWRDQLSFDYCRWKTDIDCSWIPGTICNNRFIKHYAEHPRLK